MPRSTKTLEQNVRDLRALINADAAELSSRLRAQQLRDFPPAAEKTIRRLAPAEAAHFIGIDEGYFASLPRKGRGPPRHRMVVAPIRLRTSISFAGELDARGKGARRYLPHRRITRRCKLSRS